MRYVAHRGMNRRALENTIPAFELALVHADGIELDVQLARCGTPVVFHDDTLEKIFGVAGVVEDFTAAELAELKPLVSERFRGPYEGWQPTAAERIPRLEEVLRLIPDGYFVNVEIKAPSVRWRSASPAVAALLEEIVGNYLVSSFNPLELARFARHSDIPLALLYSPDSNLVLRQGWPAVVLGLRGLRAIHPNWKLVSVDLIDRAHQRGWEVNVWTVNDRERTEWLARDGVDAVISDVPDLVRA